MDTNFEPNSPRKALRYFLGKASFSTGPVELYEALAAGEPINLIDVRSADDFEREHVPGAFNLPEGEWDTFLGLTKDRLNVLYCYSHVCHLAARAAVDFARAGYPVMEMDGGFDAWQKYGYETESGPSRLPPADYERIRESETWTIEVPKGFAGITQATRIGFPGEL